MFSFLNSKICNLKFNKINDKYVYKNEITNYLKRIEKYPNNLLIAYPIQGDRR